MLERSVYPANALPGIVVALALVTVSIRWFPAIYQTVPLLVLGYVILFLPRAVVSVRATPRARRRRCSTTWRARSAAPLRRPRAG